MKKRIIGTGNIALDIIYQREYPDGFDTAKKRNTFVDKFNLRGQGWKKIAPVPNPNEVDWEGAGDWTTSVILAELCKTGNTHIAKLTEEDVRKVLGTAVAIASRSVSYLSSNGMIHEFF